MKEPKCEIENNVTASTVDDKIVENAENALKYVNKLF